MLLRNFQDGLGSTNDNMAKNMAGTNAGTIYLGNLAYSQANIHYGGTYSGGPHVVIGAGDIAPTKEDYDLADSSIMASDKMKSLTQTATWSRVDGTIVTVQWMNNSSSAITIKEMGLALKTSNSAYTKSANVLLARKVLDTPITVQPNEVYAFTYGIKV